MKNEKTPTREKEKEEKQPLIGYDSTDSDSEKEKKTLTNSSLNLEEITQVCPITQEIMQDPVVASDGHTYERAAITDWQKSKSTSPITREPITAEFKPNVALKKQIEETHRLAREKAQAEKGKARAEKEKKQAEKKTKKAISKKESTEARLARLEEMMLRQEEQVAAQNAYVARLEEKLDIQERKLDDLDAHIRANTTRARGTFKSREDYLKANAWDKASNVMIGGSAVFVATGLTLGGIELAAYFGVAGAAALIPGPGWVVLVIMGGVAVVALGATLGTYFYYLDMDEREYARDKHLIDAALKNALNQKADGKAFDAMKAFADQHKLTLQGLPHTIFYAIAEVAKGAYAQVLQWRSGLAPAPTIAYQLQYIQSLRMPEPTVEAAKDHPVYQRIAYIKENSEMPVSTKVTGPHYVPDEFIQEGNQMIRDATPSNMEMVRSAMLQLSHTAVSTVADSVTKRSEPNFSVVIKQASVIDKEWVRQQEALATQQSTV